MARAFVSTPRRLTRLVLGGTLALLAATEAGWAQSALERNLPEQVAPVPGAVSVGEQDYGKGDSAPLGVDVAGVRLIGPNEAVETSSPHGVTIGDVPGIAPQAATAALAPFVGQPLTRAVIVRMQGELAAVWRKAGYPFLSVTVPPQEVTLGRAHPSCGRVPCRQDHYGRNGGRAQPRRTYKAGAGQTHRCRRRGGRS